MPRCCAAAAASASASAPADRTTGGGEADRGLLRGGWAGWAGGGCGAGNAGAGPAGAVAGSALGSIDGQSAATSWQLDRTDWGAGGEKGIMYY